MIFIYNLKNDVSTIVLSISFKCYFIELIIFFSSICNFVMSIFFYFQTTVSKGINYSLSCISIHFPLYQICLYHFLLLWGTICLSFLVINKINDIISIFQYIEEYNFYFKGVLKFIPHV